MKSKRTILVAVALLAAATGLWAAGTAMDVSVSFNPITDLVCSGNGSGGAVTIHYTATSSASADYADVSLTVTDVGTSTVVYTDSGSIAEGTINDTPPGDWVPTGSQGEKSYSNTFTFNLANGTYDVQVCAEQSGATRKSDCTEIRIEIACTASESCDQGNEVFGEVVGNKNVCKSSDVVNFSFKGLYGDEPTVQINGPSSFSASFPAQRAGDSCVYHLHWNASAANGGAGWYTFTVNGDTYPVQLSCGTKGKP